MNENISIHIENLGPIKGPEVIYLRPFMIFSGVSGVGKSYLAMLVHFVYRILCGNEMESFLHTKKIDYDRLKTNLPDEESIIYKIQADDFVDWINERAVSYMRNMLGNQDFNARINITLPDLPNSFTFLYSRNAVMAKGKDEMEYIETLKLSEDGNALQIPQVSAASWGFFPFMILLKGYMRNKYDIIPDKTFFMPPSRGSLVAVPDELILSMRQYMGMYQEFLVDLSMLKNIRPNSELSGCVDSANRIMNADVLHGDINIKNNELQYRIEGIETPIPITAAASSIKEISPFALMIKKGMIGTFSILFEEPESHLHPELQLKVADLLAYSLKAGSHLQITTHSDYILRHINDLIRLHILKDKMNDYSKYETYCANIGINPNITINPNDVGAYYLYVNADGNSQVQKQDISMGIPFDTFKNVLNEQIARSAELYDQIEFYTEN